MLHVDSTDNCARSCARDSAEQPGQVNIDQSHFGQLSTYGRGAAEGLLDRPCTNGLKRLPAEVGIENVSN